jgi:hypothetical protein
MKITEFLYDIYNTGEMICFAFDGMMILIKRKFD